MSITIFFSFVSELSSVPVFYNMNGTTVINNITAPHRIKSELKVKCEVVGGKTKRDFECRKILFARYRKIVPL